jgi:hypothetical protein
MRWGSSLSDPGPDGSRTIEYCGIDIDLTNLGDELKLLREKLLELGALPGTEPHYTVEGC